MKLEDTPAAYRHEYLVNCECGKVHKVLTQDSNFPEYDTVIYVFCGCGDYVEFILPVN